MLERIELRFGKEVEVRARAPRLQSHKRLKGTADQRPASLTMSSNPGKCYFCNGSHFIYFCEKFLALSIADHIKEVKVVH